MTNSNTDLTNVINEVTAGYAPDKRFALAIMQDIQHRLNYVPPEALAIISKHIGTPEAQLYAIATFYKSLSLEPKGRHIIKLCDGTACHLRGANTLITGIKQVLGISPGQRTPDGEFSLELVNCVGSCALAPVLVIDQTYYGKVTMEKLPEIIAEFKASLEVSEVVA
jgi:NADH-quinone oxidoreductase subunit E